MSKLTSHITTNQALEKFFSIVFSTVFLIAAQYSFLRITK